MRRSIINSSDEDSFGFRGYDGNNFALFGGEKGDYEYKILLDAKVPQNATHISFFVAVRSNGFDNTSGSSFVLLVDDMSVFSIDEGNYLKYLSNPRTDPRYYPVDIDIRKFADNGKHRIEFAHRQYVTEENCPSIVFLDYINFLSKPSCKNEKRFLFISFYFFLFFSTRQ